MRKIILKKFRNFSRLQIVLEDLTYTRPLEVDCIIRLAGYTPYEGWHFMNFRTNHPAKLHEPTKYIGRLEQPT